MAMNNWGGMKEHMSKKPRKFLANKRVARDMSEGSERDDSFKVSRLAQREMAQNELRIYIIYLVLFIVLGTIMFLLFDGIF